jgi:YD repeat-containing protein
MPSQNGRGSGKPVVAAVTNEAGDTLEVRYARPGDLYTRENGSLWTTCGERIPYLGSTFTPCGYVSGYDATLKSSKLQQTNKQQDWVYDACGKLIGSGTAYEWHTVGYTYWTSPGWVTGQVVTVPKSEPVSCLGVWSITYSYTQTFTDGETLTDSLTSPFLVTQQEVPPSAWWGGGNPAELPCSHVCTTDPVDTDTGDYSESRTDLSIPGRGPALAMTRTYSSLTAAAGVSSTLGKGWTGSYGMNLSVDKEKGIVTITNDNGSRTTFESNPSGGYVAPPMVLATLTRNSEGIYTYTVREHTIYTFDSTGKLKSIADLNGNKTTLSYNATGQLEKAVDGAGRSLSFSYNPSGLLSKVSDSSGRSVSYSYDEAGRLAEVVDVLGGHERYTYSEGDFLQTREDARDHVTVTNGYNTYGWVTSQKDGLVTEYEYSKGALVK